MQCNNCLGSVFLGRLLEPSQGCPVASSCLFLFLMLSAPTVSQHARTASTQEQMCQDRGHRLARLALGRPRGGSALVPRSLGAEARGGPWFALLAPRL
eukprot:5881495-Pyramimonas_sp.AAC.1